MQYIRQLKELSKKDINIAGGKAAALGELIYMGMPVPDGFVILTSAFDKFLKENNLSNQADVIPRTTDSNDLAVKIINAQLPTEVAIEITEAFKNLDSKLVAVRSSATVEDSEKNSWAGQLETYLNTMEHDLLMNVKKCWASLFLPRAISYRLENVSGHKPISIAVIVQQMVNSESAGVAFTAHPITKNRHQIMIEAVVGRGDKLVAGEVIPDNYVLEKDPARLSNKNIIRGQILPDDKIIELSGIVLKIENHFGYPVDVEWALKKDKFYILQSRPITTL